MFPTGHSENFGEFGGRGLSRSAHVHQEHNATYNPRRFLDVKLQLKVTLTVVDAEARLQVELLPP